MTVRHTGWSFVLVTAVLFVAPGLGARQQPQQATRDSTAEAPRPIPTDSIPDRARATVSRLVGLPGRVLNDSLLTRRDSLLRDILDAYATQLKVAPPQGLDLMYFADLGDLEGRWEQLQRRLSSWRDQTTTLAQRVEGVLDTLNRLEQRWRLTRATAWSEIPPSVRDQVTLVQRSLDSTLRALRPLRERLLTMEGTAAQLDVNVSARIDEVRSAQDRARRELFRQDSPVLWKILGAGVADSVAKDTAVAAEAPDRFDLVVRYVEEHPHRLQLHAVLIVLAILAFWFVGRQREAWATAEFALHWPSSLLAHPIAAGWLLAFALSRSVYADAPQGVYGFAFLLLLPALLILLRQLLGALLRLPAYVLVVLYTVRMLADTFAWHPLAARIALLALAVGGTALFVWFVRRIGARLAAESSPRLRLRAGRSLAVGAAGAGALSVLANVLGFVTLADLLITASLASTLAALTLVALVDVVIGGILVLLFATPVGRLRLIRRSRELVMRRVTTLVHLGGFLFWLSITLRQFRLSQPVTRALATALGAPLKLGSWNFTAGDVILFGATLAASVYLARTLRVLLRDDILARMDVDRGVPEAAASIAFYVALALGFVFAAGAAGIDFNRLALIAGALGVGIGFGLQNIVANFISGLILLFERPIKTGDTLEMEGLRGTVQRIGIRASIVRTFQGADMIVPNQDLIAQRVINWTLADQTRRVEIPIGVAYGSDPSQVIVLIRETAEQHPEVEKYPAPEVLFTAFGESSLDFELRAWTGIDHWLKVRSDLLTAVYTAFAEHGIEIPFPQRDLHVRSVDPEVRKGFGGAEEP